MCTECYPDLAREVRALNDQFALIREYKEKHPLARNGYYTTMPGSLLNAYREGDIGFDECVALMSKARFDLHNPTDERWAITDRSFEEWWAVLGSVGAGQTLPAEPLARAAWEAARKEARKEVFRELGLNPSDTERPPNEQHPPRGLRAR